MLSPSGCHTQGVFYGSRARIGSLAVLLGLPVLLAAGCTDDGDELSACRDVWVVGETLPKDYEGCTADGDKVVTPELFECEEGGGHWTAYHDRFFAALGGEIVALERDNSDMVVVSC